MVTRSGDFVVLGVRPVRGSGFRSQLVLSTQDAEALGWALLDRKPTGEEFLTGDPGADLLALRVPYQQDSLTQRDEALRIAYVQYRAGRIDLLWVSKLQAEQIAAASQLIRLAGTQVANRIKLQLALGSSFDATPAAGGSPPPRGSVWNGQEQAGAYGQGK
jgi:hypothetical protein